MKTDLPFVFFVTVVSFLLLGCDKDSIGSNHMSTEKTHDEVFAIENNTNTYAFGFEATTHELVGSQSKHEQFKMYQSAVKIPSDIVNFGESETCRCEAKIVSASPSSGYFWLWAVGVYHSLPNHPTIPCIVTLGPAHLLWAFGESYAFDVCVNKQIILEFAVSPVLPGNYADVDLRVQLKCTDGETISPSIYFNFHADAGEEVVDERKYASVNSDCEAYPLDAD